MNIKRKIVELDLVNQNLKISEAEKESKSTELDFSKASVIKEDSTLLAIEFSSRIIQCLKDKTKNHNKIRPGRVSFAHLKKSFCEATTFWETRDKTMIDFSIAYVNMVLRLSAGEIDVTKGLLPSEEDYVLASEDIKKYDLNFNFQSLEELYIEKESNKFWHDF